MKLIFFCDLDTHPRFRDRQQVQEDPTEPSTLVRLEMMDSIFCCLQ